MIRGTAERRRRIERACAIGLALGLVAHGAIRFYAASIEGPRLDETRAFWPGDAVRYESPTPSRTYIVDLTGSCSCLYSADGRLVSGNCNPCDPWSYEKRAEIDAIAEAVVAKMKAETR